MSGLAMSAQDKHDVKVPGGLSFSDFIGYEGWEATSMSRSEGAVAVIVGNPAMNAFFPDAMVPGALLNVDCMEKDSKRFANNGGWGYAVFDYDPESDAFKPGTTTGMPPQGNRR